MSVYCHRPFLPGTYLEPEMISTAQASASQRIIIIIIIIITVFTVNTLDREKLWLESY